MDYNRKKMKNLSVEMIECINDLAFFKYIFKKELIENYRFFPFPGQHSGIIIFITISNMEDFK